MFFFFSNSFLFLLLPVGIILAIYGFLKNKILMKAGLFALGIFFLFIGIMTIIWTIKIIFYVFFIVAILALICYPFRRK